MAKITIEKVKEINQKCSNDFTLDVAMATWYNDKRVKKFIELDNGQKLEASILFSDRRVGYSFKPVLTLHLSLWQKSDISEDMLISKGLGAWVELSEPYERKKFADIIEKTKEFDDAKILEIAKEHDMELHKECLVG